MTVLLGETMIAILCNDYETTFTGTIESAFSEFMHHLDVHGTNPTIDGGTNPTIDGQAVELRGLWSDGLGNNDRAVHLARLLGLTITQ